MKQKITARTLALGGVVAALYVALTMLSAAFGLASGVIQVRLSEAMTILPVFSAAAVPGLALGCLLANLLTGCALWDVAFGTLATLLGAIGTRLLKKQPLLGWIPPVLANAAIIPVVLMKVYGAREAWWFLVLTVGAGEMIACGLLGLLLYNGLRRVPNLKTD